MVALMKSLCFSFIILSSLATLFSVADARRFYVGGSRGWVLNPRERYNTWAERNRFQVNDTLYFRFTKGSDSVQQVMKADYDGCNVRNPIEKFDNGEAEVTLNRSGPFFFISGNQDQCLKGQKLIVVVLAIRHPKNLPISPAKPPSAAQPPKSHSPVSPVAPAQLPKAHSPVSPAKGPSTAEAPKAHSPVSPGAPANAPSTTPTPDHTPATPGPENTPPSSPTPPRPTPADNINAPAASTKNAASVVAVTSVMTTVLSVAFTVLMYA